MAMMSFCIRVCSSKDLLAVNFVFTEMCVHGCTWDVDHGLSNVLAAKFFCKPATLNPSKPDYLPVSTTPVNLFEDLPAVKPTNQMSLLRAAQEMCR